MSDEEKTRLANISYSSASPMAAPVRREISDEYAELMSEILREYTQAAAKCRFEGNDRQATYYDGIARGILISWDHFKQLENDFPTDQ